MSVLITALSVPFAIIHSQSLDQIESIFLFPSCVCVCFIFPRLSTEEKKIIYGKTDVHKHWQNFGAI